MSSTDSVVFRIGFSGLSEEEADGLRKALEESAQIQEQGKTRDPQLVAETFLAIMKDLGMVAGSLVAVSNLAEKLLKWREAARKKGKSPNIKIEYPNQPALELSASSDDQVRAWFKNVTTTLTKP